MKPKTDRLAGYIAEQDRQARTFVPTIKARDSVYKPVPYVETDYTVSESPLPWQLAGLELRSNMIATRYTITLAGERIVRRVYALGSSNARSIFVHVNGSRAFLRDADFDAKRERDIKRETV